MTQDLAKLAEELEHLLKLRSIPFGMKLCERREEMEAIPRIRRPKAIHTMDQLVGQTARLGFTIGVTAEDLVGSQCRSVVGLGNAKSPLDALSKVFALGTTSDVGGVWVGGDQIAASRWRMPPRR